MKKLFFLCCTLIALLHSVKTTAAVNDVMPPSEGWIEVTDLSDITLSDYFFSFYDRHDMMLDVDGVNLWLKFPASPLKSRTKLWAIEDMQDIQGKTTCYTLRNYESLDYVMTVNTFYGTISNNMEPNENSSIAFRYNAHTSGYWSIQACAGSNSASSTNNYIGPWSGDYYNNKEYLTKETVCATNKNTNDNWKRPAEVKIFAIHRSKVTKEQSVTPLVPAWALGHIVWEDEKNTQEAITNLVNDYLDHGIPVDGTIIDSPWTTAYNNFIWDKNRYPDSDAMIDGFMEKGVKVLLWLTGCVNTKSIGCAQNKCEEFDYAVSQGYGINNSQQSHWWKGDGIQIDFTNEEATQWWYTQLDKVYREGIYGFKVDQGETYFGDIVSTSIGTMSNSAFRPYYYTAMERYIASKRNDGFNISRPYSHQGGYHADPEQMTGGWCGDFGGDWNGLKLQIDNIYRSALKGYGAIGTEIAGFMGAKSNKQQFIRYIQFGAMTACMINGGENGAFSNHLPWWHGDDALESYKKAVDLHNSLRPYIFSTLVESHLTGCGLLQEVNLEQESHRLGTDLFTKAITSNTNNVMFTMPTEGEWVEWNTRELFSAKQTAGRTYGYDEFPLFVRRGSIIPTTQNDQLTLLITPSEQESTALLHLPKGEGVEYDDCTVSFNPSTGSLTIKGAVSRTYSIRITDIESVGTITGTTVYNYNADKKELTLETSGTDINIQMDKLSLATLTAGQYHEAFEGMDSATVDTPYDITELITDASCREKLSWNGSGRITQSGQHWSDDISRTYHSCNYALGERSQTLIFPKKGVYELNVTLRGEQGQDCCTLSLGDLVCNYKGMGYTGGTVATDGSEWASPDEATAAGKTFANNGIGYGWFMTHLIIRTTSDNQQIIIRQQLKSKNGVSDDEQPNQCGGMTLTYYGNENQTYTIVKDGYTNKLQGVISHLEMPTELVDSSIFIVDLTNARICDYSQIVTDKSPNTLIKATPLQRLSNPHNVWIDGHIASLNLTDGYGIKIPSEIIADKAFYQRDDKNTYGTLCLPFPISSNDDLQLFNINSYTTDGKLIISAIDKVKAGQPVIYKKLSESTIRLNTNDAELATEAGATIGSIKLAGCYEKTVISQQTESFYYIKDNLFLSGNTVLSVLPFWAYLDGRSADLKGISMFLIEETATGIRINEENKPEKAPIYTLQGIRVAKPSKGIYLQGGRKFIHTR